MVNIEGSTTSNFNKPIETLPSRSMEPWRLAYNVVLTASWPGLWLYYRLRKATSGKYTSSYLSRLGLCLPSISKAFSRPLWVHALSVGEVLSSVPLLHEIRRRHPEVAIVFSAATEKGLAVAQKEVGPLAESIFYLPHDHLWSMIRLVRRLRPAAFILVETDLWPNLLWVLKKALVPVLMVNARLSLRSFNGYRRLGSISRSILACLDQIYVQSEEDARRFASLGVSWTRLRVAGNLKFDLAVFQKEKYSQKNRFPFFMYQERRPLWIAGSTHDGEEKVLLQAHAMVLRRYPNTLLVLAPRHIDRAHRLTHLCEAMGLRWALRSRTNAIDHVQVFLLDSIGELASLYPLAQAAFIGGSLIPFGGHNPLEAAVHGVPCCWGPHLDNFREIEAFLINKGCGRRVHNAQELQAFLLETLKDDLSSSTRRRLCAHSVSAQARAAPVIAEDLKVLMAENFRAR